MGEKINIICWKWKKPDPPSTKNTKEFTALHVNTLYNMLQRHLSLPHQLICITDDPVGILSGVNVFPMINTFVKLGGCYRRLALFGPDLEVYFGKRFACMDLDVVIVDGVTSIFSKTADFIVWGERLRKTPYCGSMWMMDAGSRPEVWNKFNKNPRAAINLSKKKYKVGSDQSFISYCLYPNEEVWTTEDGIYNFKLDVMKAKPVRKELSSLGKVKRRAKEKRKNVVLLSEGMNNHEPISDHDIIVLNRPTGELPVNAKIVFFNGKFDPSDPIIQEKNLWIKEHWR